jgi:hypothetical protein
MNFSQKIRNDTDVIPMAFGKMIHEKNLNVNSLDIVPLGSFYRVRLSSVESTPACYKSGLGLTPTRHPTLSLANDYYYPHTEETSDSGEIPAEKQRE